ncbi:dihydroneopterin aldolase [Spirulina sp. CS-785/01]|uniref:dihydroneopterin aldolase n=1 Tax=Spirulina sp. CS-785/01 TaxID=3021716 RepID=UPI00232E5F66|nr:dihydroneopterin aldolase [Spirulina sp. CS-785/01]MDB9312910.1 dihydroneopterin aldolase [Spirulina sp. CS-785/01]
MSNKQQPTTHNQQPTQDKIHVTGIRGYGYSGDLPEEQVLGQWFEVDLILFLDLTKAGECDSLAATFDYRSAITITQTIIEQQKYSLIERLATVILEQILASDSRLEQVQIRLSKLAAPIPNFSGKITVELSRMRL